MINFCFPCNKVSKEERQSQRFLPFFNNYMGEMTNSSDTVFPYKVPEQQVLRKKDKQKTVLQKVVVVF
jgi:hypothetical protein